MSWQEEIRTAHKSSPFDDLNYPEFIPKQFLDQIQSDESGILKKQFIASKKELMLGGFSDPIGDEYNAKGSGIIHRYRNRILFAPTTKCPINCRYCFRKNELHDSLDIFKSSLKELDYYLANNNSLNEVILTGGDPFFISNHKLKLIFNTVLKYKNIKFLRFHTRFPIIVPSRFDEELTCMLEELSLDVKVIMVIHTNHNKEFNLYNETLIKQMSKLDIKLLSQSVLLKGINDNKEALVDLFCKLGDLGVSPYYLHHPDKVKGAMHFYLKLENGRRLYNQLRDYLPGWLIPHYIIDNNLGQGKQFAFNPESFEFSGEMLNKKGEKVLFPKNT